jgi:hypothetical protein
MSSSPFFAAGACNPSTLAVGQSKHQVVETEFTDFWAQLLSGDVL